MLNFNSYLTGLFEGDGHISIGEKHHPRWCLTTHEKNEPWLLKIKEHLNNYGFIRRKKKEHALVLTISNNQGLFLIINKLNGNLKTPKINKFGQLINWYNNKYNTKIKCLPINYNLTNAWLSGFIEADGSFFIRCLNPKIKNKNKHQRRIEGKFSLYQRMVSNDGMSYKSILTQIALFLNCNLLISKKKTGKAYYYINVTSKQSTKILINYLKKYPLSSSKYLDFKNWEIVVIMIHKKKHLKEEYIEEIYNLKNQMNNARTNYEWNHLTIFGNA